MAGRDFTTVCQLGKGSFGSVEKVLRHEDGLCYAMKKVKIMEMKDKDKKNALNEVRLLASIDHPNIINYKDAFFD
jgi:NIMA (never in mitosis gene a)-related kinase